MGVTSISGNALYLVCSDASVQMHNPVPSVWGKSPGQNSHSSAVQLCGKKKKKEKKKVSEKQGMFFLVLYPQMRSFPISSLSNWEAGRGDYSWGLNRRFFSFPFGPVALIAPRKAALKAVRW